MEHNHHTDEHRESVVIPDSQNNRRKNAMDDAEDEQDSALTRVDHKTDDNAQMTTQDRMQTRTLHQLTINKSNTMSYIYGSSGINTTLSSTHLKDSKSRRTKRQQRSEHANDTPGKSTNESCTQTILAIN